MRRLISCPTPLVFQLTLPLFLLLFSLAACGGRSQINNLPSRLSGPTFTSVTIIAKEFSFEMPTTIQAGMVDLTLVNAGTTPHQALLARLNKGIPLSQFKTALEHNLNTALPLVTLVGGADTIMPGHNQEVLLLLPPGQYLLFSLLSGQDKVSYASKGMFMQFAVTAHNNWEQTSLPQASEQALLNDFKFTLPPNLKTGPLLLKVENQGKLPHELLIAKIQPGKSPQEAEHYFQSLTTSVQVDPSLATPLGGMAALEPGASGWIRLNLPAGTYLALCYLPRTRTSGSTLMQSTFTQFTIAP